MRNKILILFLGVASLGCNGDQTGSAAQAPNESRGTKDSVVAESNGDRELEIRGLIEQLVFTDSPASNQPIVNPNMKIVDADGNAKPISGESDDAEKRRQKFNSCQKAFNKLYELKEAANSKLNYKGMQIKCLQWLLEKEKKSVLQTRTVIS